MFRKLPVELILKIWRYTFPLERRISAWTDSQGKLFIHFPECLISAYVDREAEQKLVNITMLLSEQA